MAPTAFERRTIQLIIDKANQAGVEVPASITALAFSGQRNQGAVLWYRAHPDWSGTGCCWGDVLDPDGCTCWVPIFDLEQTPAAAAGRSRRHRRPDPPLR